VLVTVSDKKLAVSANGTTIDYYTADVVTASDYYPGGMDMPGRQYSSTNGYRYGFNGKEKDNKDGVVQYDYGFRIYDPRLVRFKSVDPLAKKFAYYTPYQYAGNKPIWCIDMDGLEDIPATSTGVVQPFSTSQLIKWAKDDGFYLGPKSRGETVILIQDYRVVGNLQPIHKEFVLFKGAPNKPINLITQDNVTFRQDGTTASSGGPEMKTKTLRLGTPDFLRVLGKINPDGIKADDFKKGFGALSRKLTNEEGIINELKPIADLLKAYPNTKVEVSGNTSFEKETPSDKIIKSDGEDITVQQLMDGRAQTLSKLLTEKLGVNPSQINVTPGVKGDTNREANVKIINQTSTTSKPKK
jgi:RHS repeat-associated protein